MAASSSERVLIVNISHTEAPRVLKAQLDKVQGARGAGKAGSVRASDELHLSDEATEMQYVKERVSNLPDMRTNLVKQFKRQVEAGSYEVKGSEVVDSMFASALQGQTGA